MANPPRMLAQLILHEGLRTKYYQDTLENWTTGIGYNVTGRGLDDLERIVGRSLPAPPHDGEVITVDEAKRVCLEDIKRVEHAVIVHLPEYVQLSEVRQRVCVDLAFNMGLRALSFKNCIAAVKRQDWSRAVRELYKSTWARQVDDGEGGTFGRADRLAQMLLTGNDYTR